MLDATDAGRFGRWWEGGARNGDSGTASGRMRDCSVTMTSRLRHEAAWTIPLDEEYLKCLPAGGLMKLFGVELDELIKVKQAPGVQIQDNDFLGVASQT